MVNGYWYIEVYTYAKGKKVIPLSLDVFGIDDPSVDSQNLQIERYIDAINKTFYGNSIWLADHGFDGLNLYEMWFSPRCQSNVSQRSDRHVLTTKDIRILERDLIEHLCSNDYIKAGTVILYFVK